MNNNIWDLIILYAPTLICGVVALITAIALRKIDVKKPIEKYIKHINNGLRDNNTNTDKVYSELGEIKKNYEDFEKKIAEAFMVLSQQNEETLKKIAELKKENTELKAEIRRKNDKLQEK